MTEKYTLELDRNGSILSQEEYYPYGGTAVLKARSAIEVNYKTVRYSGKERDATGLYYHGFRYYQPWVGRWLSADPAGTVDGLNLFRMVRNNPVALHDLDGKTSAEWQTRERFKQLPYSIRHLGTRDILALERATWKENTFNLLPFAQQAQNDFYNNDNIYNLHSLKDKEVTVYRVEVAARDDRFMHTRIEPNGSVEIYIPNRTSNLTGQQKKSS